jgi:NTP pyrophosphatase (non-canonical NTP hydrolase)
MTRNEELLVILMEECAEVSKEASKLIRFGSETWADVLNFEKEIGDLMCMIALAQEAGLITEDAVMQAAEAKREKLKKWSNLIDD